MGLHEVIKDYQNLYQEVDEVCEQHTTKLIKTENSKPFCPHCAAERTVESEQELLEKETHKAYNSNRLWLRNRSIVANRSLLDLTFDTFEAMDEETKTNKEKAKDITRRIFNGSTANEMLAGKFGTGKTHLAMAILNQLNEPINSGKTNFKLVFVSIDEMLRRIKANFGNERSPYREDRLVSTLSKADVLVIDDLGAETGAVGRDNEASDFNVRVINAILSGRTDKPTIFTTNLSIGDMRKMYDGRILSRILRGMEQERLVLFKNTTDKRSQIQF